MKTSNVLASILFGTMAAAMPLDKRAYATKWETVVETVVVYTTVWDGEAPQPAQATSNPGLFYEHQSQNEIPSSAVATPTSAAYTPPAPESSSLYVPPAPSSPSPEPTPSSVYTPPPVSTPSPAPEPSSAYTPPAPAFTSAAAAEAAPSASYVPSSGSGDDTVHTGGSLTMNYFSGGTGSCGKPIQDTDMAVALATDLMGAVTWGSDGVAVNEWCNAKVEITYNGVTAQATILDSCSGCTNGGFDCTKALWDTLTGGLGGPSGDRIEGMTWKRIQ